MPACIYNQGKETKISHSMAHPAVVGAEYCRPGQELHLVYTENSWSSDKVTDLDGKLLLKVRRPVFSSTTILITDPTDHPILRLRRLPQWVFTSTWHAFPGPKSSNNPLLFTVKSSSAFQVNLSMHVFLGSNANPDKDQPDYKVKRASGHSTIRILFGEEIVAKVKPTLFNCCEYGYAITVAPDMDFAFVLSLFLIVQYYDD